MKTLKKGDSIYFYSQKHGTIPATVLRVGRTDPEKWTKFQGKIFIHGNFPRMNLNCWVDVGNCELQSECDDYQHTRKIGSEDISGSVDTEVTFECWLCCRKTCNTSEKDLVKEMNEDGWRYTIIGEDSGVFCPHCISDAYHSGTIR